MTGLESGKSGKVKSLNVWTLK